MTLWIIKIHSYEPPSLGLIVLYVPLHRMASKYAVDLCGVRKSEKLEKESVAKYLHILSDHNTLPIIRPAVMVATHTI